MSTFDPIYRLRIAAAGGFARNANGTLNLVGSTLLAPIGVADHSDDFDVSSKTGVFGSQPYLDIPRGRRGRIDFLSKRTDTGRLSIKVLDKKLGTGNFQRWVTSFIGDTDGRRQLEGKEAYIEESTDDGATFSAFYFGRIQRITLSDRLWITLDLYDLQSELAVKTFRGQPSPSYANLASLCPIGFAFDYGPFVTSGLIPADVAVGAPNPLGNVDRLVVDETKLGLSGQDSQILLITRTLRDMTGGSVSILDLPNATSPKDALANVVVFVRLIGGANDGDTGLMRLVPFVTGSELIPGGPSVPLRGYIKTRNIGNNHVGVGTIGIDDIDPAFAVSNWGTTTVEFAIIGDGEPTEEIPIFIDDVHPVTLWADILDGKFGPFDKTGAVRFKTPRDVTSFDTLIADLSFPLFRGTITESSFADEWIEDHILRPYNLAYFRDGEGKVIPIDLRSRDPSGAPTLTNADLIAAAPPRSGSDISGAVTDVSITYKAEIVLPFEDYAESPDQFPDLPTHRHIEGDVIHRVIDIGSPDIPPQSTIEIDAIGFRITNTPELEQGIEKRLFYRGRFDDLVQQLRGPFGAGPIIYTLPFRRTATVVALTQGDLAILDIDELQDPVTVRRGGPRLARALEIVEQGIGIGITFLDIGVNVTATTPTLGLMSQVTGEESTSVEIPVTALNASSDPVVVHAAITATSVGTVPAESSPLWFLVGITESVASVLLRGAPANTRVWARGRSEPSPVTGGGARLPSAWIFPTAPGRIDTSGITAPSALVAATIGGAFVIFTFTPGDTDLPTEVFLNGTRVLQLPAGSDEFTLKGLVAGFLYNSPGVQVRHINPLTAGVSAFATVIFTTLGTAETAPTYDSAVLMIGERG